MATLIFDSFLGDVFAGNCLTSHSYKGMLTTDAYVEDRVAHSKRSSVTNEITGTNYTAGGAALTLSFAVNTTTHKGILTIGAVSWANSTITAARKLVVYRARGGASSADELVCCLANVVNVSTSASTFSIAASTWEIPYPVPF